MLESSVMTSSRVYHRRCTPESAPQAIGQCAARRSRSPVWASRSQGFHFGSGEPCPTELQWAAQQISLPHFAASARHRLRTYRSTAMKPFASCPVEAFRAFSQGRDETSACSCQKRPLAAVLTDCDRLSPHPPPSFGHVNPRIDMRMSYLSTATRAPRRP
jgi:hypothetical protein